jgi:2'-5' RNA ligase
MGDASLQAIPDKSDPSPQTSYSLHILFPDSVEQQLSRWAEAATGASWPDWRGHITLLPWFATSSSEATLVERIEEACTSLAPFELSLNQLQAAPDNTRENYWLVMLTVEDDSAQDLAPLETLRRRLTETLEPHWRILFPKRATVDLPPHITLALSLGRQEAERLVAEHRAQVPVISLDIENVHLVRRDDGDNTPTKIAQIFLTGEGT